ncbi:uncharacterized protein [Dendropsophus ebraccatus]|uniref:uncharacterized protein isoform X3 n=1 Tax=Dendropsophus ebraccatus TaxID=150705 RepID=UPI003831303F
MSTMAMPLKDIIFSPCRVPKTVTDKPSSGSAKRVKQLNASATFSQPYSSSKQLFFPKTPRALALEMANKKLEADLSDTKPSTRSTVKWADQSPPVFENEPKIEEVAVRLFLDGEETDKKKQDPAEESDRLKGSESLTTIVHEGLGAAVSENSVNNADVAASAGVLQDSQIHRNIDHPALLSLTHPADPPVQYPRFESSLKAAVPLSFLSHPAVQALESRTLGSYSLPDIARLRIQAALSAKQRFWETCLDEECAFYTSRGAVSSYRNCTDPVSSLLERQEALHFTPIIPGEP